MEDNGLMVVDDTTKGTDLSDSIAILKSLRASLPDGPACVLGDAILHLMGCSKAMASYWGMRHV